MGKCQHLQAALQCANKDHKTSKSFLTWTSGQGWRPGSTMRKVAAYCCGELGRLGGLSTLLANGRQWCVDGGDVVRGEATVKVRGAGVLRGHLAVGAAEGTGDGGERWLSSIAGGLESATLSHIRRVSHKC